jgi:DNA-binding NarL/FixJ family response regulator
MLGDCPYIIVVGDYESANELIASPVLARVDVLIIDLNDPSSIKLIRSLREKRQRVQVLIYCCQATTQELAEAVATGAAGKAGSKEIVDAISCRTRVAVELSAMG